MRTGRIATALVCAAALAGLLGCGGGRDDSTPTACLEGADAYLTALDSAPGEVQLRGETPLGDCLADNQQAGDLSQVGEALLEATTKLNAAARQAHGGPAAVQLGYLIGTVEARSEETEGVHAELLRRLLVAARFDDGQPLDPAFDHAFDEGETAATEG